MTTPTPEQMRAQYNILTAAAASMLFNGSTELSEQIQRGANMLYVAADQLEAVQRIGEHVAREYEDDPALDAMLADLMAGTEPQQRDACYNCHGAGYHDGGDMRDNEPCHACGGTGAEN